MTMPSESVVDDRPPNVIAAQRRVTQVISELPPPAGFSVLIEVLAQEMIARGIAPGTPNYESFVRMQVAALIDRTRGICVEVMAKVEGPAPSSWFGWWRR